MAHPLVESENSLLKYSKNEVASKPSMIQHPVYREVAKSYQLKGIDFSVSSDIPAGTGLGSSSSFTVGLVHITREYLELGISKRSLAFEACDIEINRLQESVGKQDQYASALGGLNYLIYDKNGEVKVNPIFLERDFSCLIEKNTLLVRTKGTRSANLILQNQSRSVLSETNVEDLLTIKNQADSLAMEILSLSAKDIGEALNEGWALKKKVNNLVSNSLVDSQYAELLSMGVYGGKLLGAGGSGYFFVVAEERVIENIQKVFVGLTTKIKVDTLGSTRIYDSRGVQ
jgi:D-glycero-alpha-D-manno-heptose-7-phosphate kinase